MIGIYKIISPNNRVYIGQTRDFDKRLINYKYINSIVKQKRLCESFKKYGAENHKIEFIEECLFEELNIFERKWQDYYDVTSKKGLNCILTETDVLPRVYTKAYLEKSRINNLGNKNPMFGITGKNHHNSKKVINIITNEIYDSLNECCIINKLNPKYMSRVLSKSRKNKTDFLYFKEDNNYFSEIKYKPILKVKIKKTVEEIHYNRSSVKLGDKNPMYGRKEKYNPKSKKVIDTETGEIYDSLTECCKLNNLNPKYMSRSLTDVRPNKTKYKYI